MYRVGIRHLPVIARRRLVGIFTAQDACRYLGRLLDAVSDHPARAAPAPVTLAKLGST